MEEAKQSTDAVPTNKGSATNVYIHSLPLDVTDDKLHQIFGAFGEIESARVMVDFNTRASRGYGFVKFKTSDAAAKAIGSMNGYEMNGKTLVVKQANDDANGGTPSNNVYLKGLPITVTVEQLTEVFSHFGPITECRILTDAATKISRGQALVRFDSVGAATQAVQSYNNAPFPVQGNLKVMTVKFADNEDEKAERKAKLKKKMSASGSGRFGLSSSGVLSSSGGFSNNSPQIYSPYHSQFYGDAPYYAGLNASGPGNALHGSGIFSSGGLGASGGYSASALLGTGVNVVNPTSAPQVINPSAGVNVVSPLNGVNALRTSGGFHTAAPVHTAVPLPVQQPLHTSGSIPIHPINASALRNSAGVTPSGTLVTSAGAAAAGVTAPPVVVGGTTNLMNTSSGGLASSPLVVSSGITHSQGLLYASGGVLSTSGGAMTPPPGFNSTAPHNDPNVYVYHLPAETEDVHLLQRFAKYGPVQSVKVIRDPISGLCRGFGFIRYASMDAAYQAIASENGQRLGAKVLSVTLAKQKPGS